MTKTTSCPARLLDAETIANIGLYYVCFRLARYGWTVSPATRNAKGADLVACSQDASETRALQVRATSRPGRFSSPHTWTACSAISSFSAVAFSPRRPSPSSSPPRRHARPPSRSRRTAPRPSGSRRALMTALSFARRGFGWVLAFHLAGCLTRRAADSRSFAALAADAHG